MGTDNNIMTQQLILHKLNVHSIRKFIKAKFKSEKEAAKITIEHPTKYENLCWLCEGSGNIYEQRVIVTWFDILLSSYNYRYTSTPSNKTVGIEPYVVHTITDNDRESSRVQSVCVKGILTNVVL